MLDFNPRLRRRPLAMLLAVVSSLVLVACSNGDENGQQQRPPAAVETVTATQQDVDVLHDYSGRAWGAREVEVRARVEGILQERKYDEGSMVEEGDLLFAIERRPYEVALQSAQADLSNAQASLNQAQREWDRIEDLFEQSAISQRERDNSMSELELAQARYQMAEAGVNRAQINLDYTEVRAPISGATSLEAQPEGTLLSPNTHLATITQLDPIHIRFSLPERDARVQRAMRGENGGGNRDAFIIFENGEEYEHTGHVDFTQSNVDRSTGSVRARAVFDNEEQRLMPGEFVRVRVILQRLDDALIVPEQAVNEGPRGPQLFVVEEGEAKVKLVELGPMVEQGQVINSGLEPDAEVIIKGLVNLRDGAPVNVVARDGEDQS
ncbi:efflux RND transporter periplasmic adaptor subunit [Aliidiomarina sp. Khilg15.8]